ncbi:MFS transporter [Streptomyces globisporus]|nr:MFS transporter [Streptomyces globisporus]
MAPNVPESSPWIRRYNPAPDARARLLCLPHAGGSASFYLPLSRALGPDIDVLTVQYPGRQDRRHEPCVDSIAGLADALVGEVLPWADRPLAIFGHSMGAMVGFELALRLERRGTQPLVFFASGRRAPSRKREDGDPVHRRVIAELRALSGTDARVLDDEELLRMALPAIRSDYRVAVSLVATDYLTLDGARLVAGAGAGAVFSVGSAVVSSNFRGERRTRALALLGSVAGLSLAFGPTLCGLLTEMAGWRLVYGFQLVCLVLACAGMPLIRRAADHERRQAVRIDVAGAVLFCGATTLVLGGLALGSETGWASLPFLLCTVVGLACYGLFAWRESTAPSPLLSLRTLRSRRFSGITLVVAVASFTFTNAVAYLPVFLQGAFSFSPGASGAFLMFLTVPVLVAPLIAGRLAARGTPVDSIMTWSIALLVVGLVLTGVSAGPGLVWMALPMVIVGIGFGLQAGLADGEALAQVPEKEAGMGAGWINTVRLGSEAIAVSLFGSLFASFVGSAAQASRQGFAAITVGSTLFAAVIGVWSVVLMRRGRHGEARPGEPGRTVEDAQDTAGTAPR